MIYSIGYGNRNLVDFIRLLERYRVKFLIDVRSSPHSKVNPEFSGSQIDVLLRHNDVRYVFMGDTLGGRPKDASCYTADGRVDYEKVKKTDFYQAGIQRLQVAAAQGHIIALMCSELKPHECHRSKLIGETLRELQLSVHHIDENGELRSQQEVIDIVLGRRNSNGQLSLFGDESPQTSLTSRKSYWGVQNDAE